MVGAPVVGGAIGVAIGAVVHRAARARQRAARRAADPFEIAAADVRARFRDAKIAIRQYVTWKLRLDPVYRAIAAELPDRAEIVDLGAGLGLLGMLLALLGGHRRVRGVDRDRAKIEAGRRAARGLPVDLEVYDVRTWKIAPCDVVTIVDVLHYFDAEAQREVLARAAAALRPGGTILVREGDGGRGGSRWTRAIEGIAVRLGWNRSDGAPVWRGIDELRADLEALGLEVETVPVAGPLHPGNVLLRARSAE
jgi:hypothetical protein